MLNWLAKKFEKNRAELQHRLEQSFLGSDKAPAVEINWLKQGNEALGAGDTMAAMRCYQKALQILPYDVDALVNFAFVKSELKLFDEARFLLERALALDSENFDAWYMLGGLLEREMNLISAKAAFLKVIEIKSNFELAYRDLCRVLFNNGELVAAKEIIQRGIKLTPLFPDFHFYLGNILAAEFDYVAAQASFEKAVQIKPDFVEAFVNLGRVLEKQQRPDDALRAYQAATRLQPEDAAIQSSMGNIHLLCERFSEAVISFQRASSLDSQSADAMINLGLALHRKGDVYSAIQAFQRALKLQQKNELALANLGGSLQLSGELKLAIETYRHALEVAPDDLAAQQNLLYALSFDPDCVPTAYLDEAKRFGLKVAARARPYSHWNWTQNQVKNRPLRIGLVSGDLRNHPVGNFLEAVIGKIDSNVLSLVAYSSSLNVDELTRRIKPFFSEWSAVATLTDEVLAAKIHADQIDILIDLAGHTANNRLPVFAWRPSPIQVAWLGYWASTGVSEIEYILVDKASVPQTEQPLFSERLWYLPETRFCYTPPTTSMPVEVSALPALRNGHITFGSFQILSKINKSVLLVWSQVLAGLPGSRLRLQNWQLGYQGAQDDLVCRLREVGISPDRVDIFGGVSMDSYLATYSEVDIVLDTFPFPGGTTTVEALWMGVPTVTLTGNTLLARQGESLLRCAGLKDWIAETEPEFVSLAIAHAKNLDNLRNVRASIRTSLSASPLMNAGQFAKRLEDALVQMWATKFA